jgi:ubiquinone/menaquinone biosynthesis C-methylase UbiE
MASGALTFTKRQLREKEFYEQYASTFDFQREINFTPVNGREQRPWNSYWMIYHFVKAHYRSGARLLDFGSGPGENALRFSEIGYSVEGFDICESNVQISQTLFERYDRASRGHFQVAAAEHLPYPDDHFDVIAGIDILHHVEIELALKECRRVLRPKGVAIFREPVEVPYLDPIRNSWIVRAIAPKEMSIYHHITADERKLNQADLEVIKRIFPNSTLYHYLLLARLDRFYRRGSDSSPSWLERIDHVLMKYVPFLRIFSGAKIIVMKKH